MVQGVRSRVLVVRREVRPLLVDPGNGQRAGVRSAGLVITFAMAALDNDASGQAACGTSTLGIRTVLG